MKLVDQIVELHHALSSFAIPHAFGGALALAWCTEHPRATIDIDINVFISADRADQLFNALPDAVVVSDADRNRIARDGQTRLWWGSTPVDVFFNTTDFHTEAASRTRSASLAGTELPFLSCADLAVFKAFFNRTKDWADLEAMHDAGTLDVDTVTAVLSTHLGDDDPRIERLREFDESA